MAWEEWEQLKAEAAGPSAHMQLNEAPAQGGGSSKLRSSKSAWIKAGEDVSSLRGGITKALAELGDGQKGADIGGVQSAAAQRELYASWERYVKDVSGRCGALAGLLEKTGGDQSKTDQAVEDDFRKLGDKYKDTPDIGGQGKGR